LNTLCHELWSSVSIDHKGQVYSCCHNKPQKIGNIYENALCNIINAPEIMRHRKDSMNGSLYCFRDCNWIRSSAEGLPEGVTVDYSDLRTITIAFGEMCNIACIMCKQRQREHQDEMMLDHRVLIKNIDPSPFQTIFLTGGEPLAISECRRYMEHLASVNKKFGLSTNGTLLDKNVSDFLAPNIDFITLSINAATKETHEKVNIGSDFDLVLKNLEYIRGLREANGLEFDIIGRMTLTTLSLHEIPLFIRTFTELGVDRINFGYDKATVPSFLMNKSEFTKGLKKEISSAIASADIERLDLRRLEMIGLLDKVI